MERFEEDDLDSVSEGLYPMRVVSRLTGLPADTIRAWERRYGAVRPSRTDGRARRYSEAEVRRLSLLREATERGHSIGSVGRLGEDALAELARKDPEISAVTAPTGTASATEVGPYLDHVERFELRRALDLITRRAALLDPREFCLQFLEPLLEEIGRRWEHGEATVLHEHIVSTHVKMVLGVYTRLAPNELGAPRVAFLTPEGHLHEFGIHIGAILATMRGVDPIVLGPDVPYSLLPDFVQKVEPEALVFGVSRDASPGELVAFREAVRTVTPQTRVWVGCSRENPLVGAVDGVRFFHDFESVDAALAALARG